MTIENKQIQTIEFRVEPDGKTYPEKELHVNERTLKGLVWRISEKPENKDDIYTHDPGDDEIMAEERIRERENRLQEAKEAEKKTIKDLAALALQKEQDSIAVESVDLLKNKEDEDTNTPSSKNKSKIDIKKDE
jgi:hypothetical protein